jgi:hypothetical protein
MSRGWVVVAIAVGGFLFFLMSFHLVSSSNDLTVIPKEHFSFADTFISVDTLIQQYNARSLGERVRGEGVNLYLIRKLQEKELITLTGSSSDGEHSSPKVTLAKFNQVRDGMTLREVEAILGPGHAPNNVVEGSGSYTWRNQDGSSMNVGIHKGRVIGKDQWGLK